MLITSRLVLLLIVAVALLFVGRADHGAAHVAVLFDRSDAVDDEAVDAASHALGSALQDRSYDTVDFSDAEELPALFEQTLRQLDPLVRNGIVIASSGHWPVEMQVLLEQSADAGIRVSWVPMPNADTEPGITGIEAPARARVGEQIGVTVTTASAATGSYRVVLSANDAPAGQRVITAGDSISFQIEVTAGGVLELDAELLDLATGRLLDRLQGGALVNVISMPRLLVLTDGGSPFASSLAAGGWSVTRATPREFQALSSPLATYSALILDDVPADALPEDTWVRIAEAVRRDAIGLMVLGGPQSFGLGGYRGSTLESLLPVVSEPPADEPPAAVMFLVDVSGSMAQSAAVSSKLHAANAAVLHAAKALRPEDRVGLVAFDVEARQLLGIERRDDHAKAIQQAWPRAASGGTSLVPALELAKTALAAEAAEQRLLILVTDGMLSDADIGSLEAGLAAEEFELAAMIMLDGSDSVPLSRSALGDRGSILYVDDVMQLPVLMRDELEDRRAALETTRIAPSVSAPLPMASPPASWPAVDAYLLTRSRPEATVMLVADREDPILSTWTVGAGRVVAITSGLGRWASDWFTWDQWPDFAAGLVNHVAVTNANAVRLDEEHRRSFLIELGRRDEVRRTAAQLVMPNGSLQTVPLVPVAPGMYEAGIEADAGSRYALVWEDADGLHRHSFVGGQGRDLAQSARADARQFVERGLLSEWTDERESIVSARMPAKQVLVAAVLFGLLFVIAAERVPLSQVRRLYSYAGRKLAGGGDNA